jgi:hypothetical protein
VADLVALAAAVRGDLYVEEEQDDELNRATRKATIVDPVGHKVLLKPLHDVMLISVKPVMGSTTSPSRAATTAPSR